jgi:hypothetical protein
MDKADFKKYYINLLIRQYHDKPRAIETIGWAVDKKADMLELARKLLIAFDIDTATGKQLDTIGKYVNMKRLYENTYLSSDDDYRFFIKWKIISNLNVNNIKDFHESVNSVFNGSATVINNKDMSITYWIKQPLSSNIISLLEQDKNLLPSPMGVDVGYIINNDTNKLFNFSYLLDNSTKVNTAKDSVGFSEILADGSVEWKAGDFLSIDSVIS